MNMLDTVRNNKKVVTKIGLGIIGAALLVGVYKAGSYQASKAYVSQINNLTKKVVNAQPVQPIQPVEPKEEPVNAQAVEAAKAAKEAKATIVVEPDLVEAKTTKKRKDIRQKNRAATAAKKHPMGESDI